MPEFHLTTDPAANASGSGTPSDPRRVSDAASFDAVLRAHRKDTVFVLQPGTYETNGAWTFADLDFCSLGDGCGLVGIEGSARTTLRLADAFENRVATPRGLVPAQKIEMLIAGSRCGRARGIRIEGLTIDTRGGRHASGSSLPTVGVHVFASESVVRDVRVLDVDGHWQGFNEGFGILVNNCGDASLKPGG
ncbi:MAG: hypothetical protein JNL97_05150, partial [Verrucomicrobiales bacterium]|nr:hypothetical protein [Verrucomicrobiales bacterium]